MQLVKKSQENIFIPAYPADEEQANKIPIGEEVTAKKSRNVEFHRKFFSLLRLGFDNQDKYDNFEIYRQIQVIRAGFVHWTTDKDGNPYALPKSLSFENMGQEEIESLYDSVLDLISKDMKTDKGDIEENLISYM